MSLTIGVTGASGLIGRSLTSALRERGDHVVVFVRRAPSAPDERGWDPAAERLDPTALSDVDVVVNLAGKGIGDRRWNTEHKTEVLRSRVSATRTVCAAIAANERPIRLVNASAVGFYGDRGDEFLTEESPPGVGFLPELVGAWEGAAAGLLDDGRSVVFARTGLVMTAGGGALRPLVRATKLGVGGPLGSGHQFWPIISMRDQVGALIHLIDRPDITGPVNLVGVEPPRQREGASTLAKQLKRPSVLPAPRLGLRLVVGQFADDILASQRVLPARLQSSGFVHRDNTLSAVLTSALASR